MSDTNAIYAAPPSSPKPASAVPRRFSDAVDLYAEGPSFSEQDWAGPGAEALFGEDGFDYKDLLDIVNPLHHLPVVGTAYRALTGDTLAPGARLLGGTLFGGVAGFASALVNAVYEDTTGKDIGDSVLALFTDGAAPGTAVASATAQALSAPPPPAAAGGARTAPIAAPAAPAIAASAMTAGILPDAPPGENDDPVAALIRARAAVPATRRAARTGLPPTNFRSPLTAPDGKSPPIHFRSTTPPPAAASAVPAKPEPASAGPGAEHTAGETAAAAVQPNVAVLMRQALDKYETLMKGRTASSISSEI